MRDLSRNKQTLYYALFEGRKPRYVTDDDGNATITLEDNDYDSSTQTFTKHFDGFLENKEVSINTFSSQFFSD